MRMSIEEQVELARLTTRIVDLERRCTEKEKEIKVLQAWQNKAIGYILAFSAIITLFINQLFPNL